MTKIAIDIKSCQECPFFRTDNTWSTDGWDKMTDWICSKHPENSAPKRNRGDIISENSEGKLIEGCVEWHEESKIKIPKWCPAKV